MSKQSYQEVSKIMEEDLKRFKKLGLQALDDIDVQYCFSKRHQRHPERYERLHFNSEDYSETVPRIISDFLSAGILQTKYYLIK